ncbi:MAG: hypothetical protein FWD78_06985 [Treponema sp.]|nr:hypothetical protein [Treponema sp.]
MQKKITLSFLTGNLHKFIEAKEALAVFPNIQITQINEEKPEVKNDDAEDPILDIAKAAAEIAFQKYKVPVAVEDAGIFLEAYPGFPGLNTKWIMKKLDYEGILRLLKGKNRNACFRSVVAYRDPLDSETRIFEGRIEGRISTEVIGRNVDCMDYDRIFIPNGESHTFSLIMENKKKMSHRKIAFEKLGRFLLEKSD